MAALANRSQTQNSRPNRYNESKMGRPHIVPQSYSELAVSNSISQTLEYVFPRGDLPHRGGLGQRLQLCDVLQLLVDENRSDF